MHGLYPKVRIEYSNTHIRSQAQNVSYQFILFRQFTTLTFTSIDNTVSTQHSIFFYLIVELSKQFIVHQIFFCFVSGQQGRFLRIFYPKVKMFDHLTLQISPFKANSFN